MGVSAGRARAILAGTAIVALHAVAGGAAVQACLREGRVAWAAAFAAWAVASCVLLLAPSILQGTTRLDEHGARRLWPHRVERVDWSDVRSWHRELGVVVLESSGRPFAIQLSHWRSPSQVVDLLRARIPDRERASWAPTAPMRARRERAVIGAIMMLAGSAGSAAMCVAVLTGTIPVARKSLAVGVAIGFAMLLVALFVGTLPQASTLLDERGIERLAGARRVLLRWSDVRAWREDDDAFLLDTSKGPLRIDPMFWRSRAELRHVLRSHVGDGR